jgi:RNA polymerase sigma factor (sigma-70 family)
MVTLIAALPPRQRAVLALRYYDGRTDGEIAELLGCREATVRSHAARALATLRAAATTSVFKGG